MENWTINFEAVILAGGLGTRLKQVAGDVPKPMMPVADVPFLYFIMRDLARQGCSKIVLSLCYRADFVMDKIKKDKPVSCPVEFAVERTALGTGGGIKYAADKIESEQFVVANGDTFCELDYQSLIAVGKFYDLVISGVYVDNASRYGTLSFDSNFALTGLNEKKGEGCAVVNSGTYLIRKTSIQSVEKARFSFEEDFVGKVIGNSRVFISDGYFIDIGIPEDYAKACHHMKKKWRF